MAPDWSQSDAEVTVKFDLDPSLGKEQLKVKIESTQLTNNNCHSHRKFGFAKLRDANADWVAPIMPLSDYKVQRRIAEGRFGTVFAATNTVTGQTVAVKKIRARKNLPGLDFDPWYKSAERERDVLVAVRHENIIELLEHCVEPGAVMAVLIYPFLSWDLATVLELHKPMEEGQTKTLLSMLLSGLAHLHSCFVVP
ncbi:Cyclin-dependent kinase 10 [Symbiodinium microadriaticum]|uniref:Cyclin-dependent kinase 2 homolog n=1 Tax=Symbiodinium microadriaticum TaxID=2951 RepID=A0A1Q9D9V2_SYMMI|nr:Cyclin-dependent kinase 10 [Symbiodinium microadriaticum]